MNIKVALYLRLDVVVAARSSVFIQSRTMRYSIVMRDIFTRIIWREERLMNFDDKARRHEYNDIVRGGA